MNRIAIILASLLVLTTLSYAQENIVVNGKTRNMIVYAPSGIAKDRPLVISLHGMNQDAAYQKSTTKWELVADTAQFVVVYPNGLNKSWDISGSTDLNFISAIIDEMYNRYSIDKKRVYLTGFSMGGMMTYHAANNIADKIAAFGPVSGYMSTVFKSSRPIPLIHTHGTSDNVVPYADGNSGSTGAHFPGATAIASGWADRDGCNPTPVKTTPYPVGTSNSNSRQVWSGGECETEVVLISLAGKGHWHSNDPAGVYTTTEIWNFVSKYSLDCGKLSSFSVSFKTPADNSAFVAPATIPVDVSYTEGATISHIDFYIDDATSPFHEEWTSPYNFDWEDVVAGSYTLKVIAYDNEGNSAEDKITVKVNVPQAPYNGTPSAIPGTIQFEEYDLGGNGFAYSDDSEDNTGGADFRTDEDVDIEICKDTDAGYNIGFATTGEWLEYTVDVASAGTYTLTLRVACNGTGRTISLASGTKNIATNIEIPDTKDWQEWTDVTVNDIELQAGKQTLKVTIGETSYINLNYMTFTPVDIAPTVTIATDFGNSKITANQTVTIEAEANSLNSSIVSVAFYAGNEILGTDNSAPYTFDWSGMDAGTYDIVAVATDDNGEKGYDTVKVTVLAAPIKLKAGWNLIGCPLAGNTEIATALSGVWQYVVAVKDNDGFYIKSSPAQLNTLTALKWGKGYYVKVSQNCELDWEQ